MLLFLNIVSRELNANELQMRDMQDQLEAEACFSVSPVQGFVCILSLLFSIPSCVLC